MKVSYLLNEYIEEMAVYMTAISIYLFSMDTIVRK